MEEVLFSMNALASLLTALRETQRPFTRFDEISPEGILLRLDVDFDLEVAAQVAAVLARNKISATFLIQVASPLYNPLTDGGRQHVAAILKEGHRLGLHYHHHGKSLHVYRLGQEYAILRTLAPDADRVVAWHNPEGDLAELNRAAEEAGLVSAYSDHFFAPDRYVSDSNLERSPEEIVRAVRASSAPVVQVLLHPINWVLGGRTMAEVIQKTFQAKLDQLADSFSANRIWAGGVGEDILHQIRSCPWYGRQK